METNDYLIILTPAAKGNLLASKGTTSFLLDGVRRKAQVLTINSSRAEVEEMLQWAAYSCEQAGSANNKMFVDNLLLRWQDWEHVNSLPENFLEFLAAKLRKEVLLPEDAILLRNPVKDTFMDESPKPLEAFRNNHLIVCYPNDNYRFLIANIDIQHFDRYNHVILVNSNNPRDFKPCLQEAKKELEKLESMDAKQKQSKYVEEVLSMLEDDFYRREPDWKLLHRIKKVLCLKNLKMRQYQFMMSA